jgi:hypothetical protein
MTRTPLLLAALAGVLLQALPAHAQRVFVSGSGSDSNPCTFAQPCRSFQQAFNTAPTNGEIDVLDPAGYGALNITHGISIQAHGFGGISATSGEAVVISAGASDAVSLNGLLIDGAGTGNTGILFESGGSLQILNCVVRHFGFGIWVETSTELSNLLIENTIASDNSNIGIDISTLGGGALTATLSRITANNNTYGVSLFVTQGTAMIEDSVLSNNSNSGLYNETDPGIVTWLARSAISGNSTGVDVILGAVDSYGNNAINGNTTDISGTLTPASTR